MNAQVYQQPRIQEIFSLEIAPAALTVTSAMCSKTMDDMREEEEKRGSTPSMFTVSFLQSVRAWWRLLEIGYDFYEKETYEGTVKKSKHCRYEMGELDKRIARVRAAHNPKTM